MTHRKKYYLSIALFVISAGYMLWVQNRVFGAGLTGQLTNWLIAEMLLSFVVLIAAIVFFIVARARREGRNYNAEDWLQDVERTQVRTRKEQE